MNGPKFRLVSDGKHTYFELCGKSFKLKEMVISGFLPAS